MFSTQQLIQRSLVKNDRFHALSSREEYGNSFRSAENIGTLKSGKSYRFSGDVGGRDLDFFKFTVKKGTHLSAELTNDDGNDQPIALTVLDSRRRAVQDNARYLFSNVDVGETATLSATSLRPGTYYMRVQSAPGNHEDYSLKLSTDSLSNSPGSAVNLGSLGLGESVDEYGTVGGNDVDYYRFGINSTSRVTAQIANQGYQSIAFSILDQSGRTVQTRSGKFLFANVDPGVTDSLLAPTLSAGTYYLRAQSAVGDREDYVFRLSRTAATVPIA